MKRAIFFSAIIAAQAIDLNNYSFEKFVVDFNKKYDADEHKLRKELFENELARVKAHNAAGASWKEGINKYSAYTKEELKQFKGRNKGVARAHKPKYESPFNVESRHLTSLPTAVDWRNEKVVTSVKDQGHCGSCWAFAATATLESHVALNTGLLYDLSPQQIAMCSPNPDSW